MNVCGDCMGYHVCFLLIFKIALIVMVWCCDLDFRGALMLIVLIVVR